MPEFTKWKKITRAGIALGIAASAYANAYASYLQQYKQGSYKNKAAVVLQVPDAEKHLAKYEPENTGQSCNKSPIPYKPKPDPKEMPRHYFFTFVGFFNPETKGIGVIPREFAPAYALDHIEMHEGDHWWLDRIGADHDEAWINRMVANRMAKRTGQDAFPFASYVSHSMF